MAARRKVSSYGPAGLYTGSSDVAALVALLGGGARRPSDADCAVAKMEAISVDAYWLACDEVAVLVARREAKEARGADREELRRRGRQLVLFGEVS
jgi:hypothetical protein